MDVHQHVWRAASLLTHLSSVQRSHFLRGSVGTEKLALAGCDTVLRTRVGRGLARRFQSSEQRSSGVHLDNK